MINFRNLNETQIKFMKLFWLFLVSDINVAQDINWLFTLKENILKSVTSIFLYKTL